MRRVLRPSPASVRPEPGAVLELLGMPEEGLKPRHEALLREAFGRFDALCEPAGVYQDIPSGGFAAVFRGAGPNAEEAPLGGIFPRARRLALFASTVGEGVSREISRLFAGGEAPLGVILDAAASAGADRLAREVQRTFEDDAPAAGSKTLRYSPGYCGWHLGAQRKLFDALSPGEIGVTLGEGCLMEPLKSVSGVLVLGAPEIHDFKPAFPFCGACRRRTCRDRTSPSPLERNGTGLGEAGKL